MTIIRTGRQALPNPPSGGKFLKIPEDGVVVALLGGLDALVSIDQHVFWEVNPAPFVPCIGAGCPSCGLGNKPSFRAFLPVLAKEDGVKIFSFGITVLRQLEALEEELGSLEGQVIKVRRHGNGLSTKYTVIPVGKKPSTKGVEIPDIVAAIGPPDKESIVRVLVEAGVLPASELGSSDSGSNGPGPSGSGSSVQKRGNTLAAKFEEFVDELPESESANEWEGGDEVLDWDQI